MKTFEDLTKIIIIPNTLDNKYKKLTEYLNQIEEFLGGDTLDIDDEVDEDIYAQYNQLKTEICNIFIDIVKTHGEKIEFEPFELLWVGEEFWNEVKDKVISQTRVFLEMGIVRDIDLDDRAVLFVALFEIIYIERENQEYASQKLNLDKRIVTQIFRIMNFCENVIINQHFSKRRFVLMANDVYGLSKEDLEQLWKMFDDKRMVLSEVALSNRLSNLEYRITKILEKMEVMEFGIDYTMDAIDSLNDICDSVLNINKVSIS